MRVTILAVFIFFLISPMHGQTSLKKIDLKHGEYHVGFAHYTIVDSTRTYQIENEFNNQFVNRPIPVSIWYPAKLDKQNSKQLTVLDYLQILKEEEEWKNLPNEYLLDWFPYLWNTPENKTHLSEMATAFHHSTFLEGNFPVVVYAPSYQASSIENFALFEFLASNGFVVLSSPSRGTDSRPLEGGTVKDLETQSRDVEFLLKEIYRYNNMDVNRVALMGFSFGGLSNVVTAMKNKSIRALVSLDGTERYRYEVLEGSAYFNLYNLNIPYVHFAQKDIPEIVLEEDQIPEELNHQFQLYDSLRHSDVYSYKFHDLTHTYFSSFGVLFGNRDIRQDKSDEKIMASYKQLCEHSLQFLKATMMQEVTAMEFIENSPEKNGLPTSLMSKKMKKSMVMEFDAKDFNDLALSQHYQDLIQLYKNMLAKHPNLELEEGMLNTLGLKLSFDPIRSDQGVQVLLLALYIYPKSANLYDSLAEVYLFRKDYKSAADNFKKSLEFNPNNQNAIDKLEQLSE